MDGKAGAWYCARAEYMKKYFKVDKRNAFVSAMEERFFNRQEDRQALCKMRQLKYKGDIESYLTEIEALNYKVCLVSTPWRILLRDGHSEDIHYRRSATKRKPLSDIKYFQSVRRVGPAMEEYLMLQKKQSSKDNCSSFKINSRKRKHQDEGEQREEKPKDRGLVGKSRCQKSKTEDKTKGQTPVHMDKKKALDEIAPSLVEA